MSNVPILTPANKIYQPINRAPIQTFHTDYTKYNSYRYPIPSPISATYQSSQRGDTRAVSREKQVSQHNVSANLTRVRSMESFVTQGKPARENNLMNGQYTVIMQLPDLQHSQSQLPTGRTTTRTNNQQSKPQKDQPNKSPIKSKRSQSMAKIQAELDTLKQQTIYKNKQSTPTGHQKQQAYFRLFATKSKLNQMKKSHIDKSSNSKNSKSNTNKSKQSLIEETNNLRKQYNRLRNYLEQLEMSCRKVKEEKQQIMMSNSRLEQELRVYRSGKSKLCQVCNQSPNNGMKKGTSSFYNHHQTYSNKIKAQDSINDNSPKNIPDSPNIRSSNSIQSNSSVYELLSKAKQQIQARDQIITNLQTQITQITTKNMINLTNNHTIPKINNNLKINPISPFDVQEHSIPTQVDPNIYGNIQRIKQYIQTMNTQYNRLTTRIDFMAQQLNQITGQVRNYMVKYEEQQLLLMQKEVEIDVHIRYTRQIMAKLGFCEHDAEDESSAADTINQKQFQYNTYEMRNNFDLRKIEQKTYQWYPKTAETTNFNLTQPRPKTIFPLFARAGKI